jgi:hypothetical protein
VAHCAGREEREEKEVEEVKERGRLKDEEAIKFIAIY